MSDEKWNRFASTGSVRDYLEYRDCFFCEETDSRRMLDRKSEGSCERTRQLGGMGIWGRPSC